MRNPFEFLRNSGPRAPRDGTNAHRVSVVIGGREIPDWLDYEINSSMLEPADDFRLSRPFDLDAWNLCRPDEEVKVAIDGTIVLDGYIDDRDRSAREGTIEISGRDKSGRLVQASIPNVTGWDGLQLDEAIRRLAFPYYKTVSFSNARNRSVRRGKGNKASAGGEPAFFRVGRRGELDEEHTGRLDPGETCWNVIEQLCSSVNLGCWSSADGREIVVGQPNYTQAIQYVFRHGRISSVTNMSLRESIRDAYALIEVHGAGTGEDATSFFGSAKDGPNIDGTGGRFLRPKRLVLTQSAQASNAQAKRAAEREMKRRNFTARQLTVDAPLHGQVVAGTILTLFAPDTLARVIDEDLDMDETWFIYACTYRGSAKGGATTNLQLVPRGTEFVA